MRMTDLDMHVNNGRTPRGLRRPLPPWLRLPMALAFYGVAAWFVTHQGPLSFSAAAAVFVGHSVSLGIMQDTIDGEGNGLEQAYGILFYIGSIICRIGIIFLSIPWIIAFAGLATSGNLYELAMLIVLPAVYIGYPAVVVRNWKASGPV